MQSHFLTLKLFLPAEMFLKQKNMEVFFLSKKYGGCNELFRYFSDLVGLGWVGQREQ